MNIKIFKRIYAFVNNQNYCLPPNLILLFLAELKIIDSYFQKKSFIFAFIHELFRPNSIFGMPFFDGNATVIQQYKAVAAN